MTHAQLSPQTPLGNKTRKNELMLPVHYTLLPAAPPPSSTKSRLLGGLAAGFVVLVTSCFGLYMLSHQCPAYLSQLRMYPVSRAVPLDTNHTSNTYLTSSQHRPCDISLATQGNALSRRQTRDNHKWFLIPIASSRYHFVSRGTIDKSTFRVVPFRSYRRQMAVKVTTVKDPQGTARVSAMTESDSAEPYGVEISSSEQGKIDRRDAPAFSIIVYIPIPGHQILLNRFETNLAWFEHIFPDLSRYARFTHLQVSGYGVPMAFGSQSATTLDIRNSNARITMNSAMTTAAYIRNTNAPISGKLEGAKEIFVSNSNGEINGEFNLTRSGSIKLSNVNSPINARLRLKTDHSQSYLNYRAEVSNGNSPIDLKVLEQPLKSGFFLKAGNIQSALRVRLNSAFEGHFQASTSHAGRPKVQVNNRDDPSGRERSRVVRFDERGSTTRGEAVWGSDGESDRHGSGVVELNNQQGSTELFFD